jgi:WD40 repeat protein
VGNFTAGEITFPLATVWGDLDSDGDVDVLIKEDGLGYSVRTNDGGVQGGMLGQFSTSWQKADSQSTVGGVALKVSIWDVQSGVPLKWLEGHKDAALRVAINSSGILIASVSWDATVRLWDIPGGN